RDAVRHGSGTVRGRLSRHWARACEASGGDLHTTWQGVFPADELALVRTAQAYGNARLLACFQALAVHLALLIQARRTLWATLGSAAVALLVASALLLALPQWTVPSLRQAFQGLPPAYLGDWSRALFSSADGLRRWGIWLPVGLGTLLLSCLYSLPHWHGPLRSWLDRFGPWRLYRHVQALRLLALVSILLQPGAGGSTQLRPVILLLLEDADPWLGDHLERVAARIDQ